MKLENGSHALWLIGSTCPTYAFPLPSPSRSVERIGVFLRVIERIYNRAARGTPETEIQNLEKEKQNKISGAVRVTTLQTD